MTEHYVTTERQRYRPRPTSGGGFLNSITAYLASPFTFPDDTGGVTPLDATLDGDPDGYLQPSGTLIIPPGRGGIYTGYGQARLGCDLTVSPTMIDAICSIDRVDPFEIMAYQRIHFWAPAIEATPQLFMPPQRLEEGQEFYLYYQLGSAGTVYFGTVSSGGTDVIAYSSPGVLRLYTFLTLIRWSA